MNIDKQLIQLKEKTQNLLDRLDDKNIKEKLYEIDQMIPDIKSRRKKTQAQKQLNESAKLYRSIFSAANTGIGLTDTGGVITDCNRAFAQMLNFEQSELIGTNIAELTHPDELERENEIVSNLDKDHPQVRFEKRFIKSDGSVLWADINILAIFEQDEIKHYVGILADITDKKKYEIKLKQSEEKYRNIFESNQYSISVFSFNEDGTPGRFIEMNDNAAKLIGRTKEEALQLTPVDIEHNITPEKLEERKQQFEQKGKAVFEIKLKHKSGRLIDAEVHATPLIYNGRPAIMNVTGDITARKNAERYIKEREEQFRTIFNHSPQPMALSEAETGKIIQVNENFCKKVEGKKEDIQNKTVGELGFYKDRNREKFLQTLLADGKVEGLEMHFKTLKGNHIITKMFSRFLTINKKQFILTIFEDITEKRKTEEELQMLSSVVRQSPSYIVITDLEGKIEYTNPAFTEITGYEFEEIKNQNPRILKSGKVKQETYRQMWQTITQGKPWRGKFINRKKSGEEYTEKVVIAPIKNKSGEIIKYFAIKEDITQQIKTEKALKENEIKFKAITAYAKDAIILIDNRDTIKFWNKAAETIFNYKPDEVNGKQLHKLIVPSKYQEEFRRGFEIFKKTGQGKAIENTIELTGLKKSGKEFPVEISISAIHIENQLHAIGIIRDITERKESEVKLNQLVAELKTSNATKDKFFNIIAHDLKNPFNSIVGFSDLLVKKTDSYDTDKIKKFAQTINSAGKNTYKLLQNLLEWSRAQTGKLSFDPEALILENIFIETIAVSQEAADSKSISLNYTLPESLLVKADQNMLNTIMRNLISNAVKFTDKGGSVNITAEQTENYARISVTDNGLGMNKETLDKLFKIDEKVTKIGTNNEKGTGLGLLLCKEFVENQGGEIWAESNEGQGSTFTFTVPLAE